MTAEGAPNEDVTLEIVRSNDGGMTWTPTNQIGTALALRTLVSNNATLISSRLPGPNTHLEVGSTYRFGLRVSRGVGSTANIASYHCHLIAELRSRTGTTFPF